MTPGWYATPALVRGAVAGVVLAGAAVLLRRPDAVVLAAPLLAISVWSVWRRPAAAPAVVERLAQNALREGESTWWTVEVRESPGSVAEDVAAVFVAPPWGSTVPRSGVVCADAVGGDAVVRVALRSTRWGRREVGPALVVASSAWGAFRFVAPARPPLQLTTLPLPATFDSAAPLAHPVGVVGRHRSARPGEGSEFASLRPFHVGDRLRRIHWPRSLRTGELHVTSTWSDQDTLVVLVVDALNDLGTSGGIDGDVSSLDVSVRAAGAIAEHYLRGGDRVALHVVGSRAARRVPAASGIAHLRRVLDALATIVPGTDTREANRLHLGLPAGALVVMLSPLTSPLALQRAYALAARGLTVVVIDTLPPGLVADAGDDPFLALAWRIRLLERRREIRRIQQVGVPVVAWRGPGSLDQVLRDLHRHAGRPRVVQR
jgi:uncharacterized protein (DUF58 family)